MEQVLGYLEVVDCEIEGGDQGMTILNNELQSGIEGFLAIRRHSMVKIGRHKKECDVVFNEPSISSVHCVVWVTLFDDEAMPMFYIKDTSLNGITINGQSLKKNIAYLLQDNDIIDIWNHTIDLSPDDDDHVVNKPLFKFVSHSSQTGSASGMDIYEKLNISKTIGDWEIGTRVVGNGTFGHVLVCYKDSTSLSSLKETKKPQQRKCEFAVKIIKMKPNRIDKEAKILLTLKHPNIIQVYRTFNDLNGNLYIFQDLIPGGDLFSYLAKGSCLSSISEQEALLIVFQILHALKYLHDHGIVHRDLKLDNILLNSPEPCTRITLADFGIAKTLTSEIKRMHTVVGTPEYCAPEVGFKADRQMYSDFSRVATIEQEHTGYDQKCDLWSLGVITHIMLSGISPFYGDGTEKSIVKNTKIGNLNFSTQHWSNVSPNAKEFVKALLTVDVEKRLDAQGALNHPWISKHLATLQQIYDKKILTPKEKLKLDKGSELNKENINIVKREDWKKKTPKATLPHSLKKVFKPTYSSKKIYKSKIEYFK